MHNTTAGSHMACNIPVCILCTYVIVYMNVYMCVLEHGYIESIYIYRYTLINTYAHTHTSAFLCAQPETSTSLRTHANLSVCVFVCVHFCFDLLIIDYSNLIWTLAGLISVDRSRQRCVRVEFCGTQDQTKCMTILHKLWGLPLHALFIV